MKKASHLLLRYHLYLVVAANSFAFEQPPWQLHELEHGPEESSSAGQLSHPLWCFVHEDGAVECSLEYQEWP